MSNHLYLPYRAAAAGGGTGGQITFVSGECVSDTDNAPGCSFTLGTHQADDFGLTVLAQHNPSSDAFSQTVGTGWTQLDEFEETTVGNYLFAIYYRKFTSSSETNPTFATAQSEEHRGIMMIFRGVDTTTPFDVTWNRASHFAVTAGDTDAAAEPITTVNNGAAIALFQTIQLNNAISTFGAPSGYTMGPSLGLGNHRLSGGAYLLDAGTAGTKTPGDWTHTMNNATDRVENFTFALRSTEP